MGDQYEKYKGLDSEGSVETTGEALSSGHDRNYFAFDIEENTEKPESNWSRLLEILSLALPSILAFFLKEF